MYRLSEGKLTIQRVNLGYLYCHMGVSGGTYFAVSHHRGTGIQESTLALGKVENLERARQDGIVSYGDIG